MLICYTSCWANGKPCSTRARVQPTLVLRTALYMYLEDKIRISQTYLNLLKHNQINPHINHWFPLSHLHTVTYISIVRILEYSFPLMLAPEYNGEVTLSALTEQQHHVLLNIARRTSEISILCALGYLECINVQVDHSLVAAQHKWSL